MNHKALVATQATLTPHQMGRYFSAMNGLGLTYEFLVESVPDDKNNFHDPIVLGLYCEGVEHNCTRVLLHPNGTWSADTLVTIGEKP